MGFRVCGSESRRLLVTMPSRKDCSGGKYLAKNLKLPSLYDTTNVSAGSNMLPALRSFTLLSIHKRPERYIPAIPSRSLSW